MAEDISNYEEEYLCLFMLHLKIVSHWNIFFRTLPYFDSNFFFANTYSTKTEFLIFSIFVFLFYFSVKLLTNQLILIRNPVLNLSFTLQNH